MYCTYLTVYYGNKLPPFYIGHSTVSKVKNGYHGSVQSNEYKISWKMELKNNPQLFKTIIISYHKTKEEASTKEIYFQMHFQAHKNPMYSNRNINSIYFHNVGGYKLSEKTKSKMSKSKTGIKRGPHSEEWRRKIGESLKGHKHSDETRKQISETNSKTKSRKMTDGHNIFNSSMEASIFYKVTKKTINQWIKSSKDNWHLIL